MAQHADTLQMHTHASDSAAAHLYDAAHAHSALHAEAQQSPSPPSHTAHPSPPHTLHPVHLHHHEPHAQYTHAPHEQYSQPADHSTHYQATQPLLQHSGAHELHAHEAHHDTHANYERNSHPQQHEINTHLTHASQSTQTQPQTASQSHAQQQHQQQQSHAQQQLQQQQQQQQQHHHSLAEHVIRQELASPAVLSHASVLQLQNNDTQHALPALPALQHANSNSTFVPSQPTTESHRNNAGGISTLIAHPHAPLPSPASHNPSAITTSISAAALVARDLHALPGIQLIPNVRKFKVSWTNDETLTLLKNVAKFAKVKSAIVVKAGSVRRQPNDKNFRWRDIVTACHFDDVHKTEPICFNRLKSVKNSALRWIRHWTQTASNYLFDEAVRRVQSQRAGNSNTLIANALPAITVNVPLHGDSSSNSADMNNMQHLSGMNLSSVQHMSGISDMSATIDDHLSDERKMADEPPLSTVNSNPAAASLVEHELQLTKRMHEDWCRCLVVNLHRDAPSFTIQPEMAQQFPFTEEMKTAVENRIAIDAFQREVLQLLQEIEENEKPVVTTVESARQAKKNANGNKAAADPKDKSTRGRKRKVDSSNAEQAEPSSDVSMGGEALLPAATEQPTTLNIDSESKRARLDIAATEVVAAAAAATGAVEQDSTDNFTTDPHLNNLIESVVATQTQAQAQQSILSPSPDISVAQSTSASPPVLMPTSASLSPAVPAEIAPVAPAVAVQPAHPLAAATVAHMPFAAAVTNPSAGVATMGLSTAAAQSSTPLPMKQTLESIFGVGEHGFQQFLANCSITEEDRQTWLVSVGICDLMDVRSFDVHEVLSALEIMLSRNEVMQEDKAKIVRKVNKIARCRDLYQ